MINPLCPQSVTTTKNSGPWAGHLSANAQVKMSWSENNTLRDQP